MNLNASSDWYESNQRYLTLVLAGLGAQLEPDKKVEHSAPELEEFLKSMEAPPALENLVRTFGLSPFERQVLMLAAAPELDSSFAKLYAELQGDPRKTYPTFSLALGALPDAHWSALTPSAPLRYWRLLDVDSADTLTRSPLRIDERILHYLAGVQHMDERFVGIVEAILLRDSLVPSHAATADQMVQVWSRVAGRSGVPAIQLCGVDVLDKRAVAASACEQIGLKLFAVAHSSLPTGLEELETFLRLWDREAVLTASALLFECDEMDLHDAVRMNAVTKAISQTKGILILSCRERLTVRERPLKTLYLQRPGPSEQRTLWRDSLGEDAERLNGWVEALASQFRLSPGTIHSAGAELLDLLESHNGEPGSADKDAGSLLWEICRANSRQHLDELAQRIETTTSWDDLVLPEHQKQTLREIAMHVRQRMKVYEHWGFGARSSRGLGISALFTGASGTGKTMAAEVLANELALDLYRIDLSQVVSKYVGETEKNLRRIFDAAEEGGAILLFDEADALFGKRSEVKDSHDRYANIEISYLLQRMESYRGLAILTTNMKEGLDTAFLRRIRFVVQFPFPDASYRAEIWKRVFPRLTPTDGLDINKLARLNVAGGNIRNIALNAAFLAAADGGQVQMTHLLKASRSEYTKLEKPLASSEIGGWAET